MLIARYDAPATRPMHHSDALGAPLLHDGERFGADVIEFPPGGKVAMHSHPGAHCLFCTAGAGWVITDHPRRITVGDCYLIRSGEPHAVEASKRGLRLIVVGNDHRPVDSAERLDLC